MARLVVKKTTTTKKRTTITLRPKSREELATLRSENARKQKRGPDGRFT